MVGKWQENGRSGGGNAFNIHVTITYVIQLAGNRNFLTKKSEPLAWLQLSNKL